mgnify:CR=1 FL=1
MATVANTLAEFENIPGWSHLDAFDVELVDTGGDLVTEKRVVQDRFESAVDTVGSDPLGAYLLRETKKQVDWADSRLENVRDNVRSYESEEWQYELDRTALRYRSAAAEVDVIPEIVALVADED